MSEELVQLALEKIMQTRAYTAIILRAPEKSFAIYTEPTVGKMIHLFLTRTDLIRPFTHDLIDRIFKGFDMRVKHVVIHDVQETIYYARLFLEQEEDEMRHIVEIDARPSDCLTLAVMHHVPIYCRRDVLERVIPLEE